MQPEPREPSQELSELAGALRRHVRRRGALGVRRTRAPAKAESSVAPPPIASPPIASQPAPASPRVAAQRPAQAAFVDAPPKPAAAARTLSPALAAAALKADEIRARAAQCSDLASLRAAVAQCTACELCKTRTQTVFSDGTAKVRVMFVGEAPGENEDLQGVPFVGKAGQLLSDIIEKGMKLSRQEVYIANVLKCRPPGNRDPSEAEKKMCTQWLDRQIELVDPQVIVPLGRHAANHVLGLEGPAAMSMSALRGKVHQRGARKVVPTFHPAYLLRSPSEKKECWKDIQLAMGLLGLDPKRAAPNGA